MMHKKITLFAITLLLFLVAAVLAQVPGDWWGIITVDGSIAPDGTIVTTYLNESSDVATTHIVGTAEQTLPGYYLLHVVGASSDTVSFKVCGVETGKSQSWSEGDHPQLNLSITTIPDGSACTYDCGCKGGQCVHNICRSSSTYCGDGHCDSGETCSNCGADCGSCTTGTGGGGGGGSGGGATEMSETKTFATVTPATPVIITITKSDALKIQEIRVEAVNALNDVKITVKEGSRPATSPVPVGSVYKYVEISKVNIEDGHISVAKIKFKIERSWIDDNNIDKATIVLNRLYKNEWAKLTTTKLSEDTTYIYYEAESPGLSVFAITGEKKVIKAACPYECCAGESNYVDKVCPSGYECKNSVCVEKPAEEIEAPTEEPTKKVAKFPVIPKIPTRWIIAGAVIAVALIVLAVLARKKLIRLPF